MASRTPDERALCERFAPRILAFGRRHLRDDTAAKDLVQEVLIVLLQRIRSGREPDELGAFVLGVARNLCLERHRKGRREVLDDRGDVGAAASDVAGALAVTADPLARDRLLRCLAALTDRSRAVVVMTWFEDASAGEIATSLGLTEANVRVVRHRGLAQLRACVEPGAMEVA